MVRRTRYPQTRLPARDLSDSRCRGTGQGALVRTAVDSIQTAQTAEGEDHYAFLSTFVHWRFPNRGLLTLLSSMRMFTIWSPVAFDIQGSPFRSFDPRDTVISLLPYGARHPDLLPFANPTELSIRAKQTFTSRLPPTFANVSCHMGRSECRG